MSPVDYKTSTIEELLDSDDEITQIITEDDKDYFDSIINRQITPTSSKVVEVFWNGFDNTHYTIEETYKRGSGIVKARVQVLVTSVKETVETVHIIVS